MDFPTDFLAKLNIEQLIAIAAMLWFLYSRLDKKFDKIDERFTKIDEKINSIETRLVVVETRMTDISNNVSHLMWHNQSLPQKEVEEQ